MTALKLFSDLTALAGADTATGDLFVVEDISAAAGAKLKKISRAELALAIAAAGTFLQLSGGTLQPAANTTPLAVTGYSLTGSNAQSLLDLAGTWNTSGTPTALKLNVTDTSSNAASLLLDLQVGGASKFSVGKAGAVTAATLALSGSVTVGASAGYIISGAFGIFNNSSTTAAFRNTANSADVAITASVITLSGGILAFGASGPKLANNTGAVIDAVTNDGATLTPFRAASIVAGGSAVTITAANSVSPTSPNRTITITYNGTTYYLAAKTTND